MRRPSGRLGHLRLCSSARRKPIGRGPHFPGKKATDVLGRTAQLTVHEVLGRTEDTDTTAAPADPTDARVLPDETGQPLRLKAAELTGQDVRSADARIDQQTGAGWHVTIDFTDTGRDRWTGITADAACHPVGDPQRRVAVVLDGKIISSPQVASAVTCEAGITGGTTQITGSFDAAEARELALLISGGALPVPVEVIEQRTIGAILGDAAITAAAWAAVIGTSLTALFVIAVYRLMGLLATLALTCYGLISYATLAALGATLTLPGLAGFVLTIGMAVDANILVFERAREEHANGNRPSTRSALAAGFRGALSVIADSNITTLIAAGSHQQATFTVASTASWPRSVHTTLSRNSSWSPPSACLITSKPRTTGVPG